MKPLRSLWLETFGGSCWVTWLYLNWGPSCPTLNCTQMAAGITWASPHLAAGWLRAWSSQSFWSSSADLALQCPPEALVLPPLCCRSDFWSSQTSWKLICLFFPCRVSFQADQSPDPADCMAAQAPVQEAAVSHQGFGEGCLAPWHVQAQDIWELGHCLWKCGALQCPPCLWATWEKSHSPQWFPASNANEYWGDFFFYY